MHFRLLPPPALYSANQNAVRQPLDVSSWRYAHSPSAPLSRSRGRVLPPSLAVGVGLLCFAIEVSRLVVSFSKEAFFYFHSLASRRGGLPRFAVDLAYAGWHGHTAPCLHSKIYEHVACSSSDCPRSVLQPPLPLLLSQDPIPQTKIMASAACCAAGEYIPCVCPPSYVQVRMISDTAVLLRVAARSTAVVGDAAGQIQHDAVSKSTSVPHASGDLP